MKRDCGGFTLVELIIGIVLGTLLIAAALQVLITNQRTYTAQNAQIQGEQTTRAALDALSSDLREISPRGGDLISMSDSSVTIRAARKLGLVCALSTSNPPLLTVLKVGDFFAKGDSVFIFADNNTSISSDDAWIAAEVKSVDSTSVTCGTKTAQTLSFSGQGALFTQPTGDSVRVGAEVRSFVRYTYGLMTYQGKTYLSRTDASGTESPMVGPLDASSGLHLAYLDSLGSATATSTAVRMIQVTIKTSSPVTNSLGDPVSDSTTTVVYTRN